MIQRLGSLLLLLVFAIPLWGEASVYNRIRDDEIMYRKAKDIYLNGDIVEGHIQELSRDVFNYLSFAYQLSLDVKRYNQNGQFQLPQRSLVADALAILVSRNYSSVGDNKSMDIQNLIHEFEKSEENLKSKSRKRLNKDFYSSLMSAVSFSSVLTDSFYQRALIWSLKLEPKQQVQFFRNWMMGNRSQELTEFLNQFSKNNQIFLRELSLKPEFSHFSSEFWIHFFKMAQVQVDSTLSSGSVSCRRSVSSGSP
ncbi:MAG: hypothetical protein ACK5V3_01400 [Bdellovibrionales bacterium]